jgi:hypothetical protein
MTHFTSLLVGFVFGFILGEKIKVNSKKKIIFYSFLIPFLIYLVITVIYIIVGLMKESEYLDLNSKYLHIGELTAHSVGFAIGKYIFGYLALGITFSFVQKLKGIFTKNYFPNGVLASKGYVKEGKQDGLWIYYNIDGEITSEIKFKNGKMINSKYYNV